MRNKLILSLLCAAVLTGCGEYNKVLKSSDTNYKYEYAKKRFRGAQIRPGCNAA